MENKNPLAKISTAALLAEIERRKISAGKEPPPNFCDDCAEFEPWKGPGECPPSYKVCGLGHKVKFFRPNAPYEMFGFYRLECEDFITGD